MSESTTAGCPMLTDGQLSFEVKRADGTTTTHELDLLVIKLACEQCERRHQLKEAEGRLVPTPEFLQDLSATLAGLGLVRCTPTIAWQVWISASEQMATLKKTASETPS